MTLWLLGLFSGLALALGAATLVQKTEDRGQRADTLLVQKAEDKGQKTDAVQRTGGRGQETDSASSEPPPAQGRGELATGEPGETDRAVSVRVAPRRLPLPPGEGRGEGQKPEDRGQKTDLTEGGQSNLDLAATPRITEIWRPFNAERAAQGFARRLSLAAGVDLRVIGHDRDGYHVGLRHRDNAELQRLLARIEQRTGLRLDLRP